MDEIWTFMEGATAFINENSWIKAHCWFGAMEDLTNVNPDNSLMNSDGTAPNDLGYYFIYNVRVSSTSFFRILTRDQ